MPTTFAQGSRGRLIQRLQTGLSQMQVPAQGGGTQPALDPANVTGNFGPATRSAVQRVQASRGHAQTGEVDAGLWMYLTGTQWPSEYERSLNLLASFEGHNYTKAAGTWDGVGVTWGVIGFTLLTDVANSNGPSYGSLHKLLNTILTEEREIFYEAFGVMQASVLEDHLRKSPSELLAFGRQMSDPARGNRELTASWQSAFARLGSYPQVQERQDAQAKADYYDKALAAAATFATEYNMASERTNQLFFDIQVNNGGLGRNERREAKAQLDQLLAAHPNATLEQKLNTITNVLATSRSRHARDIRERKGTISNGLGTVHGKRYRLNGWGIDLAPPPPLPVPAPPGEPPPEPAPAPLLNRLGILGFDPTQVGEQIQLTTAVQGLVRPEAAVSLEQDGVWPTGNGSALIGPAQTRSLSLGGLVEPTGQGFVQQESEDLLQAVNLVFRDPVGILALFGQATRLPTNGGMHAIIGRGKRGYAGISLQNNQVLQLVRTRGRGLLAEFSQLDMNGALQSLASCQLLMLYSGFGIAKGSLPGQATGWRQWMGSVGARPIVLGWFGSVRLPRDAAHQFVAGEFFKRLKDLAPGADLETLCADPQRVVMAWGQACHATFAEGPQKHLWFDEPIPGVDFVASGAAALDPDGVAWTANSEYVGTADKAAMVREAA